MKKRTLSIIVIVLVALMVIMLPSCNNKTAKDDSKGNEECVVLYPIENKYDTWGFMDANGNMIISPRFYRARPFSEGLAAASVKNGTEDEKWGYINTKGEFVIKPVFMEAEEFKDGFARVVTIDSAWRGWCYSYIDKKGEILFSWSLDGPMRYDGFFSDGLMSIQKYYDTCEVPKYGFINMKGELVINYAYDLAHGFKEGMAPVNIGFTGIPESGKWAYINTKGEKVIEEQFDDARDFSEGLAAVRVGDFETGKWGYIDKNGRMVIAPIYDDANNFSYGLAAVLVGDWETGKWGYINKEGEMVIAPQFSLAGEFSKEGLAAAWTGKTYHTGSKYGYINTGGEYVIEMDSTRLSEMVGFELECYWGGKDFKGGNGLALVEMRRTEMLSCSRGRETLKVTKCWGYMNPKGEFVWLSAVKKDIHTLVFLD